MINITNQATTPVRNRTQLARFATIGVVNTAIDFGLLFLLTHLGLNPIVANYISTGCAFVFSFIANRNYTFKAHGGKLRRQLVLFFVVTLSGLWILQPLILWGTNNALAFTDLNSSVLLFIGKLLASIVTLTWNYIFYSRLVFKTKDPVE